MAINLVNDNISTIEIKGKKYNIKAIPFHGTAAEWANNNSYIPKDGEIIIYDIDENYNYKRIKIGNGLDVVSVLPFLDEDIASRIFALETWSQEIEDKIQADLDAIADTISTKKDRDLIVTFTDGSKTTSTHTSEEIYAVVNEGTAVYFNNGGTNFHYLEGASSVVTFYTNYFDNDVMQADAYIIRGNKITHQHFQNDIITQSDVDTSVNNLKNELLNGAKADWDQNDTTASDYIKNKPNPVTSEEIKALFN